MAKKSPGWPAPKLQGKTVVFAKAAEYMRGVIDAVKAEGGKIVRQVTAKVDYVVIHHRSSRRLPEEKQADQLNAQGAAIQVVEPDQLPLSFTDEEAAILIQSGQRGRERWRRRRGRNNLSGIDLRGADLHSFHLVDVRLDGADLRDCNLSDCHFDDLKNVKLDNTNLHEAGFYNATGCSFKKADLTEADISHRTLTACDFTGATLRQVSASELRAPQCIFRGANLPEAELEKAKLKEADLARADLSRAKLAGADLSDATLVDARLVAADLAGAKLAGADLTRADLTDAILVNADLTSAKLDGADFTGANLVGAKLPKTAVASAKGLEPDATAVVGKIGPKIRELAKVAKQCRQPGRQLDTWATIDLAKEPVTVRVTSWQFGNEAEIEGQDWEHPDSWSFGACMIGVTRRFVKGRLRFDSVKVSCSKGPLKPAELKQLAVAAWAEAMGVTPPSAESLRTGAQEQKQAKARLREELLELLKAGSVKAWNRRLADAAQIDNFRRIDLSAAKLSGIVFAQLDLEEARFDGATLERARFTGMQSGYGCNLKRASFRNADLRKAEIGVHAFGADFEGANLAGADLNCLTLVNANLKNANLSGANLKSTNLHGADFTGAKLEGAKLEGAEFNETTRLPEGFAPPKKMLWVGKHIDPREVQDAGRAGGGTGFPRFHQAAGVRHRPWPARQGTGHAQGRSFQAVCRGPGCRGDRRRQEPDRRRAGLLLPAGCQWKLRLLHPEPECVRRSPQRPVQALAGPDRGFDSCRRARCHTSRCLGPGQPAQEPGAGQGTNERDVSALQGRGGWCHRLATHRNHSRGLLRIVRVLVQAWA